jgi:ABC-type transport system involved in multi-copper enzyme maturation permease subunit
MSYQSKVTGARDGFGQVVRAEWTKFRSVRSTVWCTLLAIGLTALISGLFASAGGTDANEVPPADYFTFVHRPMTGDGSIVAQVSSQKDSHEWAKAGVIIKNSVDSGTNYAAVMVTPRHGVRLEANYNTQYTGSPNAGPRWVKLTRTGTSVTGFESADGVNWTQVGTAQVGDLPQTAEIGLFVTSPPREVFRKIAGGAEGDFEPTNGQASFANVAVEPATAAPWKQQTVAPNDPNAPPPLHVQEFSATTNSFTVDGNGDISGWGIGSWRSPGNDDLVVNALGGIFIGLMALITLGVLFASSEYKTGQIRSTFAASPKRARVFAAKALVLSAIVFPVGLIASVVAVSIALPGLRRNGFRPPAYPDLSVTEPMVLRAVLGTAVFLTALAVFSLALGTILRRSARAITLAVALVLVPQIVSAAVPSLDVALWLHRLTPVAGLAVQQTVPRFDTAIGPLGGLAVIVAYALVTLGIALAVVRRRDA